MKWTNESANNPGYSAYSAIPERDANVLYAIRHKRGGSGFWLVFVRNNAGDALRTIYAGTKLAESKKFVADLEKELASAK